MDFEASNLADARAWRLTRAGILTCFVLASAMLVASLALAKGSQTPEGLQIVLAPEAS